MNTDATLGGGATYEPPGSGPSAAWIAARLDRLPVSGWHRKITFLVGIGSFFDLYEVFLGGVLATVVAKDWNLDSNGKSAVVASAFLGMFVGANVLGTLADRFGRRTLFMVNLAGYGIFSVLTAFSPDLGWLLVLRFLTGIGVGAELTLVDTYLAEFLPRRVRGRYIAWAYTFGFIAVPLVGFVAARTVASSSVFGLAGWRLLLILGGIGSLLVWVLRRRMPESPRWLMAQGRAEEAERITAEIERTVERGSGRPLPEPPAPRVEPVVRVTLGDMFRGDYRRRTIMWWIFQVLQTVGYYGFGSLASIVLVAKGYTTTASLGYTALTFLGYPVGSALAIPLVDRFERKRLIIVTALGMAAFGLMFGMASGPTLIVIAGFMLTLCSNVFSDAYHIYQTELFPTGLRSSAIGIAYSLSRLTSAILPFIALSVLDSLGSTAVFLGSAVLMGLLCLNVGLLGPRTTGLSLEAVAETAEPGPTP